MDEFSSKTACVENEMKFQKIFWMSFPWFPNKGEMWSFQNPTVYSELLWPTCGRLGSRSRNLFHINFSLLPKMNLRCQVVNQ